MLIWFLLYVGSTKMIHKHITFFYMMYLLALISARCPRPHQLGKRVCARVYEHSHHVENLSCRGASRTIRPNENRAKLSNIHWNDRVSALVVRIGCKLDVYQHTSYKGKHQRFTGTAYRLKNYSLGGWINRWRNWNNRISAWSCFCY